MIESNYSGEIQIGELVHISPYSFGIYIGRGKGKSVQFYNLYSLQNLYLKKITKVYACYIYGSIGWRVMKYSPELFNKELKEVYNNAIKGLELLKQNTKKK